MTTGERMKARRKEIGLSAEQVAERLGVSPATIYRYENGDIEKMPGSILEPISKILFTSPAFLMGWEESPLEFSEEELELVYNYRLSSREIQKAAFNMLQDSANESKKSPPASTSSAAG